MSALIEILFYNFINANKAKQNKNLLIKIIVKRKEKQFFCIHQKEN